MRIFHIIIYKCYKKYSILNIVRRFFIFRAFFYVIKILALRITSCRYDDEKD